MRPGRIECWSQWSLVQEIYRALTGYQLPGTMPPREWRRVDGAFRGTVGQAFIFELDEKQHYNEFRATTIGLYPKELRTDTFIYTVDEGMGEVLEELQVARELARVGLGVDLIIAQPPQ